MSVAAVFLDRDGTIIKDAHYPKDASTIEWLSGAVSGLRQMQEKGYRLFIVSNQSGVGRGLISHDQFLQVHFRFQQMVCDAGITIDEYFYCLDAPNRVSAFRKPNTGMISLVWKGQSLDCQRSYVVGDRRSDLELGMGMGLCANFLVRTGLGKATELELSARPIPRTQVASDLIEIANIIPAV
jgi:D-glycero-D-manno-heptose 1,7-bisphosphate phosphatase